MRIGLLINDSISLFRLNSLKPILADKSFSIELAVMDDAPKKTVFQKLKKHIKRRRGGYIIVMALQNFFGDKEVFQSTEEFCMLNRISLIKTKKLYSIETINAIRSYNLDVLLLIGGFGIIKDPLLSIAPNGILSYHHGDMRKYRGMAPGFWELYNNEEEMGVTVQILAAGLDNGIPIVEKKIKIRKNDSFKTLQKRAYDESFNMMYESLQNLSNKDFVPEKIETFGKIYTLPNLRQWIMLNIKILWRKLKFIIS